MVYIAGIAYSGSTILGHVLGEVEGFFYAGELRNIWQRGLIENRVCGCGQPFGECPFWSAVLTSAFPQLSDPVVRELARVHAEYHRSSGMWALAGLSQSRSSSGELARYRDALRRLYASMLDTTGANVIVDSSKSPWYAWTLSRIPEFRLHVVHLVRDPRANVYSFLRRNELGLGDVASRAARWDGWHAAIEAVSYPPAVRYTRLRYEDFVSDAEGSVREILARSGMPNGRVEGIEGTRVELHPKHIFSGNRSRGVVGDVELRLDTEWRTRLPAGSRAAVVALTFPLLRRYGYPRA